MQQFHSFLISVRLNALNPPTPESIMYVMEVRLDGLKHNIFGARRWRYTGGGDKWNHYTKKGYFIAVCQHFCPSMKIH